jgi:hypothetical protein
MSMQIARRTWTLAVALGLWPATALSQTAVDAPPVARSRPVSVGGAVSAIVSPRDDGGFFNYTDYDQNGLRVARARLFGEWRLHPSVSVMGELRVESDNGIDVAGLYVRWRPWAAGHLDLQAGRIPPVFGGFGRRVYGRDNPVLGTPLAYQYLTSLRPDALPSTLGDLVRMRGRGWRPSYPVGSQAIGPGLALVSALHWDTGVEARWQAGRVEAAGAWTRGSPAAPVVRETNSGSAWSGRVAVMLLPGMTVAASGARGAWIDDSVLTLLPGNGRRQTSQSVVGADVEYGSGPWLVRGEWVRSVFDLPVTSATSPVQHLSAWSAFAESRYRLRPRWQVAARLEHLAFSAIANPFNGGTPTPWDFPVDRLEATIGYRASRQLEIRGGWQQNWRDGGRVTRRGFPAFGLLYWF